MSASLEKLLSPIKYFTGGYLRSWQRNAIDNGITVVVCYHRIVVPSDDTSTDFAAEAGVPVDVFTRQLDFLARHFEPVLPSHATVPGPGRMRCTVTFDDGYLDNYLVAAPILRERGLTAGFFVCTDFVGTERWFWWEALAEMLRRTPSTRLNSGLALPEAVADMQLAATYDLGGRAARERACEILSAWLGSRPQDQIELALGRIAEVLDVGVPSSPRRAPLMGWHHLRELRHQGFEIGAHTANHVNLAHTDSESLRREMVTSHERLEAQSDGPVKSFAYPYGRSEHLSQAATEMAGDLGYLSAFTTQKGVANGRHDPLLTPRIHLNPRWHFGCAYNIDDAFRHNGAAGSAIGA